LSIVFAEGLTAAKLNFEVNLCKIFAEDQKQNYCGDLFLGWEFCKALSSTISKQDFSQTFGEVLA